MRASVWLAALCSVGSWVAPAAASGVSIETRSGIRGVTVGPIENALHPGKGYGSAACARTMAELARLGANWTSITPYGRIANLAPTGIDWSFEVPYPDNRAAVAAAIRQAHQNGLRVMLVPHLWIENGEWRGEINPGDDAAWQRWMRSYRAFLLAWAAVAAEAHADMMSVGVELRSWVTSWRAATLVSIIADVRKVFPGPLTYSGNWDDVEETAIFSALDMVGINAFYPLADHDGAGFDALLEGGRKVASRVRRLGERWNRPVVFTEVGYTTRPNPAVRPWEWPDTMAHVVVDQQAQAEAYRAILAPVLDEPAFAGFFVWRVYADPDDVSQEAEWGFSPRGKLAELVVRDAFTARWRSDGPRLPGDAVGGRRALIPGVF
jgi:Glycoside Hydrolase Family 113